MNKHLLLIAAAMLGLSVQAQSTLDYKLRMRSQLCNHPQLAKRVKAMETISVIGTLKDGEQCPTEELEALGVKVVAEYYGLVAMHVNPAQLEALGKVKAFSVINADEKVEVKNDKSHIVTQVADVQNPNNLPDGLKQIYTGKDVLVGVVDQGIDYQHKTFMDEEGNSRIKRVWRRTDNLGEFIEYNTPEQIATLTTDSEYGSHGSHTTGTAAGSYNGEYTCADGSKISGFRGAAYESEILLSENGYESENQLSIAKMWEYARSQKKPLVVNMSLGGNDAWMDGKNSWTTFFKNITKEGMQDSLLINVAAGNEGWGRKSFYKAMAAGETLMTEIQFSQINYSEIMICSDDATPFSVTIKGYDADGNVAHTYNLNAAQGETKELFSTLIYTMGTDDTHDGRYFVEIMNPNAGLEYVDDDYTIEITTEKACTIRYNGLNSACGQKLNGKAMPAFYLPNDDSSLNNMIQCKYAFAVGAYTIRVGHDLYDGSLFATSTHSFSENGTFVSTESDIAPFSSWVDVPYKNNTDSIGVDFLAPGDVVLSAINHYDQSASSYLVAMADENNMLGAMYGTSMATPNATGIMALWLQACPSLSVSQVREIIKKTADTDEYTRANTRRSGLGKINCLKGMVEILRNYTPTGIADLDTEADNQVGSNRKFLENNHIVIMKNGARYNVLGIKM